MTKHNLDPQFRKDVLKAKAKYRKRRKFIILSVLSLVLVVTLVQTFFYIREKKQINAQLKEQSQQIEKLEKEAKVNEVVIDKLKDPQFITDLVRQEYGLSYGGELIFSLPQQENFLKNAIEAIMQGQRNIMVGIHNDSIVYIPLSEAIRSDKPFDKKLIKVLDVLSI